jgi:hypothetical protein
LAVYSASTPKERVLARFHRESEAAIALVQTLSEEVAEIPILIPRPIGVEDSSLHWSAAMVLEHLVTVNLGIAGFIRELSSPGNEAELSEVRIRDVNPSESAGREQIERLREAAEIYGKTVTRLKDLRTTTRHPHPWFGPLDARGWHALAAIHNGLHRRQIEAIVMRRSKMGDAKGISSGRF